MNRHLIPQVRPEEVREHKPADYILRFCFGAGIALVAGILGMKFGARLGGVLLGFPAILPASLTLIEKKDGKEQASIDSVGAILGAAAMVAFAVFVSLVVTAIGVVPSLLAALVVWLVVAAALYVLVSLVFRREPEP